MRAGLAGVALAGRMYSEGCLARGGRGWGTCECLDGSAHPTPGKVSPGEIRVSVSVLGWKWQVDPSEVITSGLSSHLPSHGSSRRQTRRNLSHSQLPI